MDIMNNGNGNSYFPLPKKNFMVISKQHTVTQYSVGEQLSQLQVKTEGRIST
jgi:hypothetical protein